MSRILAPSHDRRDVPGVRDDAAVPDVAGAASPPARRPRRHWWRDLRLVAGLLLVVASVAAGSLLLSRGDPGVTVLVAAAPLSPGEPVAPGDLGVERVHFADQALADRYLPAGQDLAGLVPSRPVAAGELVPRALLTEGDTEDLVRVPLAVDPGRLPATLHTGSVVDVWAVPVDGVGGDLGVRGRVLRSAPVLAVRRPRGLAADPAVRVVVGVGRGGAVAPVVDALAAGGVLLVERPAPVGGASR